MAQKWRKLGQIYHCKPIDVYLLSHASNPLAVHLRDDVYRVFFSGRNKENKSAVGYVDIDLIKKKVISICKKAIFTYGDENTFYSHGVSIGTIYEIDKIKYILFMGWQIRDGEHWRGDIGRLKLINQESLVLDPKIPFLSIDKEDPISLSYPFVIKDDNTYKMWYGSTIIWTSENGEMIHIIKYATSSDGINWVKQGLAIPYQIGVAQAFSRPSVIKDEQGYHMWFSYRSGDGTKYRIGYAHSSDSKHWDIKQLQTLNVGPDDWDSEMVCYPYVFDHDGNRYMLYNGNGYGKSGFGLAILDQD